MRFKKLIKFFENHNVCVTGLVGTGKDLLIGNVIARRKQPYISNIDYGGLHAPLNFNNLDLGENNYLNFLSGEINFYEFPYPRRTDIYLSDAGVYFPAQYCNELNRDYKYVSGFMALIRHVSRGSRFHINVQNLNRLYDKIREMSDTYITCRKCIYIPIPFFNIVIQFITIYDKYDSCVNRVRPCRVSGFSLNPVARSQALTYRDNFFNTHGSVKNKILIYRNRSSYDTYHFEKLLKGGSHEKKVFKAFNKNKTI